MASANFIEECKKGAYANRLGKFNLGALEVNQSNYLKSIEIIDSIYNNGSIIGSLENSSAEISFVNLPDNVELEEVDITPQIGVKYSDNTTEFETFDKYTIENIKDSETSSKGSIMAYSGGDKLDKPYVCTLDFTAGPHTIAEFYEDACTQIGLTPESTDFTNSTILEPGNPFTNNETIRTVLQEIEKTSCSIININWEDSTISLGWLSTSLNYTFDPGDYSTLGGSLLKYGPVNCVILGNSQTDGENVTQSDSESIAEFGETDYMIDASYFLYNQDLREQAIEEIYNKLSGLTYYDVELTSYYGKPFLKKGDMIQILTPDGKSYLTYVLQHQFSYDGSFTSIIKSPALNSAEQKYKNDVDSSSIKNRLRRTELIVDKQAGTITGIIEDVGENTSEISQMQQTISSVTQLFQTTGGSNLIKNSQFMFDDVSWDRYSQDPSNDYVTAFGDGYDGDLLGQTISSSKIRIKNYTIETSLKDEPLGAIDNLVGLIPGSTYTLNFYYSADSDATCEYWLYGVNTGELMTDINREQIGGILENNVSFKKISHQFIANDTEYYLGFSSETNSSSGGYMNIYDLMLNLGDEKSWEMSASEVYATNIKLSQKGLFINSSVSNTQTQITTDGFYIKKYNPNNDSVGDTISELNDDGIITDVLSANQIDIKYDSNTQWVMKEVQMNDYNVHHIEYFDLD